MYTGNKKSTSDSQHIILIETENKIIDSLVRNNFQLIKTKEFWIINYTYLIAPKTVISIYVSYKFLRVKINLFIRLNNFVIGFFSKFYLFVQFGS